MKYTFETDDALEAKNLMNANHMYSALWDIQGRLDVLLSTMTCPSNAKVSWKNYVTLSSVQPKVY